MLPSQMAITQWVSQIGNFGNAEALDAYGNLQRTKSAVRNKIIFLILGFGKRSIARMLSHGSMEVFQRVVNIVRSRCLLLRT